MHRLRAGLLMLAGLAGATGVALAAAGAHLPVTEPVLLHTVAVMLLVHAALVVGLVALSASASSLQRYARAWLAAASVIVLGLLLFAGDVGYRAVTGARLLVTVAPAGGLLLMAGWLGVAVVAGWHLRKRVAHPALDRRDLH